MAPIHWLSWSYYRFWLYKGRYRFCPAILRSHNISHCLIRRYVHFFTIKEAVPCNGALRGGAFINEAFLHFVKTRRDMICSKVSINMLGVSAIYQTNFDSRSKASFCVKTKAHHKQRLNTRCPDNPKVAVVRSRTPMSYEDVGGLYIPQLKTMMKLLDNQGKKVGDEGKSVRVIYLLSGFHSSKYIGDVV